MATTTNFGWETPDDTDLVKDGAAAIRTSLNGVDSSFVDLKGGTTGQVLSKASGTDLDFTWVAQDDSNAIQNAIVDAKGDLIAATAADTPARLAVGTNGQVLTADSTASTGIKWATPDAGGMTVLASGTLSGSQINITSINQTYKNLQLVIRNFKPATDGADFRVRISNDSTAHYLNLAAFNTSNQAWVGSVWAVSPGNDNSSATGLIVLDIYDYANTSTWKMAFSSAISNNSGTPTSADMLNNQHYYNQAAAISEINLLTGSGNFTSGDYFLLGVK